MPAMPADERDSGTGMSFLEHLDELRRRVVWSALCLLIGFAVCYPYRRELFALLERPLNRFLPPGEMLAYTSLTEPFMVQLKVAALAGIFVSSPFVLLQIWLFVAPGLYRSEKRYAIPFVLFGTLFFLLGGAFGYGVLFPSVCKFFLEQGEGMRMVVTMDQYFTLIFWTVLGIALTFELPVVLGLLARLNLVTGEFLYQNLHLAVVGALVLAAVITPTPDALTMLFVAVPMIALYCVGIVVAKVLAPRPDRTGPTSEPRSER